MRPLLRPVLLVTTALGLAVLVTLGAAGLPGTDPATDPARPPSPHGDAGTDAGRRSAPTNVVATLQARLRATPQRPPLLVDPRSGLRRAGPHHRRPHLLRARPTRPWRAPRSSRPATRCCSRPAAHSPPPATTSAPRCAPPTPRCAVNPYSAQAEAVRSDALTELGRYDDAARAARHADDLDPGPSTFARLSYQAELRGDLAKARRLMQLSLEAAGTSASSYAFAAFHLGELSRTAGRPGAAAHYYRNALDADPTYLPALAGRARLAVARGDLAAAERDYLRVVQRLPLTEYVVELGELYDATGRPELARQQYAVATATARLLAANGVVTDLETALFQADHGSPAEALAAARAEWAARHSIHTADALGWALHAAGRDREALRYVRLATRLGTQDARLLFHRGAVESALGLPGGGRATCAPRSRLDAGVSPCRASRRSTPCSAVPDEPARACGSAPSPPPRSRWSSGCPDRRQRAPAGQLHRQPLQRRRRVDRRRHRRPRPRPGRDPDRAAQPVDRHRRRRLAVPTRAGARGRRRSARDAARVAAADGRRHGARPLAVRTSAARSLPGQAGLPTLRLECGLRAPVGDRRRPPRSGWSTGPADDEVGWREMTARGDGTTLSALGRAGAIPQRAG